MNYETPYYNRLMERDRLRSLDRVLTSCEQRKLELIDSYLDTEFRKRETPEQAKIRRWAEVFEQMDLKD